MSFNKEVCKAFFNFDSNLNKGHGIVHSIYSLINRKRNDYFLYLEQRIAKESVTYSDREGLTELLILCWKNLPEGCSKWSKVALMFFTTDIVEKIARTKLDTEEYKWFKINAERILCYELDFQYRDQLTKYAWDIFNISENTIEITKKPFPIFDVICCSIFLYSVYRIL